MGDTVDLEKGDFVGLTAIYNARNVDLYQFLVDNDIVDYAKEGDFLRIKDVNGDRTAITVMKGCNAYTDWAEDIHDDSIAFMTDVCGYTFQEAVRALNGDEGFNAGKPAKQAAKKEEKPIPKVLKFPEKETGLPKRLYAYLTQTRCIPGQWVERFIKEGLMYQAVKTGDIVFVNKDKSCYEIRSTFTQGTQKKRGDGRLPDDYWFFSVGKNVQDVFVCEGAIDAISLLVLQHKPGVYVSLHSVVNAEKILKRLRQDYPEHKIILAVDTDEAGENCARDKRELYDYRIIPDGKDWNEDLKKMKEVR